MMMIGAHPSIASAIRTLRLAATTDCPVLITGESGTGKELAARIVHDYSARSSEPMVSVNCGAIPEDLIDSELFGHVKGSFSGASRSVEGKVSAAHGGTLFLDEIGDASPRLQLKLLRFVQEKRFFPVGSTEEQSANVRIVAATNRNLEQQIELKKFRQDLFYRLDVISVHLPPLRERGRDIETIACALFEKYRTEYNKHATLSAGNLEWIKCQSWPGNIRQLQNAIMKLVIIGELPVVQASDVSMPEPMRTMPERISIPPEIGTLPIHLNNALLEYETRLIRDALDQTGWNKQQASRLLQINRTTLVERVKRLRLVPPNTPTPMEEYDASEKVV